MIKLDIAHKNFVKHLEGQGRSGSTLLAYGKDIEQLANFLSKKGINLVHEIELEHLQEFMSTFVNQNYTNKSISRKTNSTKTFFKFLKDKGHIQKNVAEMLRHPKVDPKAPRILSKIEYRALRDAAKNDARTYAIIELLLQTGITISELADIKLSSISSFKEPSTLTVGKRGNRDTRVIPLNKAVLEAIKRYMETDRAKVDNAENLLISKTGKPLLIRNIRSTIDKYFELAGIENAKVNDMRHTFVAHHLASGVSIVQISRIAGHKRLSTTEKYLEYVERNVLEEKMELGVL